MPELSQPLISKPQANRVSRVIYESGAWLFNIGFVIFIGVLVLSGGLYFYRRSLEANRQSWLEEIQKKESDLRPDLLGQLVDLANSMAAARELLASHIYASNALLLMQEVAHPKVQFTSFAFARDAQKIDVNGLASSYETVAEEISILEAHPQIQKVDFGGLSAGEKGLVTFKLAIIFKPSLLQLRGR